MTTYRTYGPMIQTRDSALTALVLGTPEEQAYANHTVPIFATELGTTTETLVASLAKKSATDRRRLLAVLDAAAANRARDMGTGEPERKLEEHEERTGPAGAKVFDALAGGREIRADRNRNADLIRGWNERNEKFHQDQR